MALRRRVGSPIDVLLLTTGLWFVAKLLRFAFPPLFEPLQAVYGVSSTEIGLAYSGFMLCYAAMQFPSGVLRDRIGPVRVLVAGGAIAGFSSLALNVDIGFLGLAAVMLVIGAGTGLHKTVSVTLLARVYPNRTGRVLGVHDSVGAAAGLVAPLAVVAFLSWTDWRSYFVVIGIGGLAFAGLAAWRIPRHLITDVSTDVDPSSIPWGAYGGLLADRGFVLFVVVTATFAFAYNGVVAFLPLYLIRVNDVTVGVAGVLFGILFAATFAQLITGELSDRRGRLPIILGSVGISLIGLTVLLLVSHPLMLAVAIATFGLGAHGYRPPRDAYLTGIIPDDLAGGGIGMARTVLMVAGAIAPAIIGATADVAGFRWAFLILVASLLLAFVAIVLLVMTGD